MGGWLLLDVIKTIDVKLSCSCLIMSILSLFGEKCKSIEKEEKEQAVGEYHVNFIQNKKFWSLGTTVITTLSS